MTKSSRRRSAATATFTEAAPVFAALGEPTRLSLVARLCSEGPLSITKLSDGAGVTRQAVTKHLEILLDAGLVHSAREGRERVWQLDTRRLERARHCLDHISDQWDHAITRLRDYVKREAR